MNSLSPSAVSKTVGCGSSLLRRRRASVHNGRTALARTHVRRNVRSRLRGTLSLSLGAQAEAAHVELIRHVVGKRVTSRVDGVLMNTNRVDTRRCSTQSIKSPSNSQRQRE